MEWLLNHHFFTVLDNQALEVLVNALTAQVVDCTIVDLSNLHVVDAKSSPVNFVPLNLRLIGLTTTSVDTLDTEFIPVGRYQVIEVDPVIEEINIICETIRDYGYTLC